MHIGSALVADLEAAELGEPGQGSLDRPAVASEPFAAVDAAPCDARNDAAGAALTAATTMIKGFEVMRQIGETLGSGARTAAGDVSEFLRHTAQRQQEMAQRLTQARTPQDVLDIQTRYYQDNLRELFGLTERLSRNTAETARQAGQQIGGTDKGSSRA